MNDKNQTQKQQQTQANTTRITKKKNNKQPIVNQTKKTQKR